MCFTAETQKPELILIQMIENCPKKFTLNFGVDPGIDIRLVFTVLSTVNMHKHELCVCATLLREAITIEFTV